MRMTNVNAPLHNKFDLLESHFALQFEKRSFNPTTFGYINSDGTESTYGINAKAWAVDLHSDELAWSSDLFQYADQKV